MKDLERIEERGQSFQRQYNSKSKRIVHMLGTNIALFICILLPFLLVGFVWTDFGLPQVSFKLVSEGIVTVALFFIGEVMMMRVGSEGGKLDSDYISERNMFREVLDQVNKAGTMLITTFCEWQVDVELEHAIAVRLHQLRLTRKDWDALRDEEYADLKQKYGRKKAKKIYALHRLEPIELNEALLLYENGDISRGGVPISGEDFLRKKSHSFEMMLSSIFCGLLTISVAITITSDISFARVLYTIFKVVTLLFRMAVGYNLGTQAYNTIEVKRLQAKNNYLRKYLRFLADKTYLKLGDRYGDVECYREMEEGENVAVEGTDLVEDCAS